MQTTQPVMERVPPEAMPGFSPLQQINDATLTVYSHVYASMAAHSHNVAENWESLSAVRRMAHSVGRLVGNTVGVWLAGQSARAGGWAANNIDDIPFVDLPPLPSIYAPRTPKAAASVELEPAAQHAPLQAATLETTETIDLLEVAETHRPNKYNYDFQLTSNIDTAPQSLPLGEWSAQTGHGTVWNQTLAYADELGYGNLDEAQKRQLTQHMLDFNGLTWTEARDLGTDYEPKMPTQRVMQGWLDEVDAERTYEPDRPAPAQPVEPPLDDRRDDNDRDGNGQQPGTEADDGCHRSPWITWIPWLDCHANYKDWIMGGVLAVGAVGVLALSRRRAEEDDDDDADPGPDPRSRP